MHDPLVSDTPCFNYSIMSNDNFQTPVSSGTRTGKEIMHEDEGFSQRNSSAEMSDSSLDNHSQLVCPRLDISTEPQPSHSDERDAHSSGNDSTGRESEGQMGRGASTFRSHNGKGSTTETTENKSSNGNSPSPPSSSVSYSLLSGSSERNHPNSQQPKGCSNEQPARLQTQRELLKALRELKIRMPKERRGKGQSSTLASLQYALSCVKQVRANQEYYHQWSIEESHGCCLDLSSYTIEELDNITSEYTLQNTDTFSVAVSFLSGKVVYISSQAASLLRCTPERLQGALFSELLAPQDVSTFYSSTAPCRLPPWASCAGTTSQVDCAEEKSMFCRISRGKDSDGEMKYYPFRLTPYQLTLRDSDTSHPEPCCLLIAERVHSGYEAPRIPADKRIFTTSHTPNCLFQEVDERAVPLLGYLPQDLVGKPVLIYLHPDDRLLMVAIHKKILQFAGKPFEHSPLRMRARSGEYLTLDTSWSSFINPWSRKVAFIVGRHKVRTSPLNEDVFTAPEVGEVKTVSPEVLQLNELIHRYLVQPIHSGSSQGYGSLGSSGSHELQRSATSSSESNGHASEDQMKLRKPMTFEKICQDVHMVKASGQQVFMESRNRPSPPPLKQGSLEALVKAAGTAEASARERLASLALSSPPRKELPIIYSYQQINCLDSIIRYLESFNVPGTVKRKCGSSSCTTSSTSDDDKQRETGATEGIAETLVGTEGSQVVPAAPAHPLTPLALHCKAESVVSVTSQCSFSSTIVHVGDKKPPESDIVMMDELPTTPTPSIPAPPTSITSPIPMNSQPTSFPTTAAPEKDKEKERRGGGESTGKGLTKAVLSAHTQQEEQAFLNRFRDVSQLRMAQPNGPPQRKHTSSPGKKGVNSSQNYPSGGGSGRWHGRGGKRRKHQVDRNIPETPSGSGSGPYRAPRPASARPNFPSIQHSSNSWPSSVGSQTSGAPVMSSFPPGYMPMYPISPPFSMSPMATDTSLQTGGPRFSMQGSQMFPPVMPPPVMTFMLPNYMFPQLGNPGPQLNPTNMLLNGQLPPQMNPLGQFPSTFAQINPGVPSFNPAVAQFNPLGSQINPAMPAMIPQPFYNPNPQFTFPNSSSMPAGNVAPTLHGQSRSSTPQSTGQQAGEREGAGSPLFQSRCSSPLNLLQLEELPSNRTDAMQQTPPPGGVAAQGCGTGVQNSNNRINTKDPKLNENTEVNEANQDAMSTSSDMLDLLLQEDSRSGTGSAASGSGSTGSRSGSSASGSNGCSTSGSGTRSSNTSKYFGSIDSSENDHSHKPASGDLGGEQFIKFVLQDPIWLLMANTDDKVMMTYQIPVRDRDSVLKEDRDALKAVLKHQPHFTEEQKKELTQVHPWIQTGCLPKAINITSCTGCGSPTDSLALPPFELDFHEMDLSMVLREDMVAETAFPLSPPISDTEQKDTVANAITASK
ncbi:period circadian protein homolog 1a [Xyrauchen texanus]|uniref:period circadian protein homolog 1a n=1 Tax=Xyrauchen texanus TaxID=154827 RepID=UPI002241E387|nr:period circadian protein homolog 1a [Xyrauchen texanus]XP_051973081.1 period circadian protein homolog 1a [Xyrauchen texanus]